MSQIITRYYIGSIEKHYQGGMYGEEQWTSCDINIQEHPEGGWVKWEDVKKLLMEVGPDGNYGK